MSLPDLLEKLRGASLDRNDGYARRFEAILAEIIALRDPSCVPALAALLDDDSPLGEPMCALIGAIEKFEPVDYVRESLVVAADLGSRAPGWALILFSRMLNSHDARAELIRLLPESPLEARRAVRLVMGRLNSRDVRFVARTTPVIMAAM